MGLESDSSYDSVINELGSLVVYSEQVTKF